MRVCCYYDQFFFTISSNDYRNYIKFMRVGNARNVFYFQFIFSFCEVIGVYLTIAFIQISNQYAEIVVTENLNCGIWISSKV